MFENLWVEKYRPKTLKDIILPQKHKQIIRKWIDSNDLPHLLLVSNTPGTGKSSLSKILIKEFGVDSLFINASLYPNIDTLRSKIQNFLSSKGISDNTFKIVVLDEMDYTNANTFQPAFRSFMEEFSEVGRFIMTANYEDRIMEPIRNRAVTINFDTIFEENKKEILSGIYKYLSDISKKENLNLSKEQIIGIIKQKYPSIRGMITLMNSEKVVINSNVKFIHNLKNLSDEEIVKYTLNANPTLIFGEVKQMIINNEIPALEGSIIYAKYQDMVTRVRDVQLNALAMLSELKKIM